MDLYTGRITISESEYDDLLEENQRYKQALEFYADRENHEPTLIHEAEYENGILVSPPDMEPSVIYFDKGEKARKALKGDHNAN